MNAIEIIKESRQTHIEWAAFFKRNPDLESLPKYKHLGGYEFNKECIENYNKVIAEIEQLQKAIGRAQYYWKVDYIDSMEDELYSCGDFKHLVLEEMKVE